ncbi:hypothetical protein ACFLTE_01150 [Bacteroidota bacterium]
MNFTLKHIITFSSFLLSINTFSSENFQTEVNELYIKILQTENINKKLAINDSLINLISSELNNKNSLKTKYDSIENLGILKSNDKSLTVFNWHLQLAIGIYQYFGIVQKHDQIRDSIYIYILHDKSDKITDHENYIGNDTSWFGALFYEIIEKEIDDKIYYTLLGFDYNSTISRKKIIEVLYFDNNQLKLGYPLFKSEKKVANRVIFEYSSKAVMTMNYDFKTDQIIFDHLSPSEPNLIGHYEFYGPDFSYDAFKFIFDSWIYYPAIDVKNSKQKK